MGLFSKWFKKRKEVPQVKERNVFNLQVGDILTYDLEDYEVVGKMTFNDGGYEWYEYQLQGEQKYRWLSVEMDDELEAAMYEKINEKITEPIPDQLSIAGVTYRLDEKGRARVRGEGRGKNVNGQDVHYFDFSSQEEELLSVEIWGSEVEVSRGKEVEEFELNILAGS